MLKIYGVPISVHTRKVIVAAIYKDLAYENIPVVPIIPDNPPANWPQLSPTGKIPVLTDGDRTIADSTVICAYLDRAYPSQPLYPSSDRDYIETVWLEEYADGTIFRDVLQPLFVQKFVRPNLMKLPGDQAVIDTICNTALPRTFGYLDSVAGLGTLAGKGLTVAQVAIVSNLVTYRYLGFSIDQKRYPHLSGLFERIVRHPSMIEALRAERPVVEAMGFQHDLLDAVLA